VNEIQQFRKKPTVTQVIRWDGSDEARKLIGDRSGDFEYGGVREDGALSIWVTKSDTWMWLPRGDWAALEADGTGVYPLAEDVRQASYEPADVASIDPEDVRLLVDGLTGAPMRAVTPEVFEAWGRLRKCFPAGGETA
jgi:hypothetical protein